MKPVFAYQPFPRSFARSLYLAGPTPRDVNVPSWRPQALEILNTYGYDDVVFVPEPASGEHYRDYDRQMDWELEAMRRSDIILFWIPADEATLPAITTRVEFGLKIHTGRVVLGAPEGAYKTRYLDKLAERYGVACHRTLKATLEAALERMETGAERIDVECLIPLEIWHSTHFQQWYEAQRSAGHVLKDVRNVEWVFRVGSNSVFPFYIALHVAVEVSGEGRIKDNEVVIIRPDIVTICAYCPGERRENDRFVIIKEYRASAINEQGFVYEFPGGSSFKPGRDLIELAVDELERETGIELAPKRFRIIGWRQLAATMIANRALLLAARLEPEEMDRIAARQGRTYGEEVETERTCLYVLTRREIIKHAPVDYATLGQLSLVGDE